MAASGHSTYTTANLAAYAADKVIKRDFKLLWDIAHPLIAMIVEKKKNFNRAGNPDGLTLLLPVQFDDLTTVVDGVADASSLTAITPVASQGDTQATYIYSRYHGAFWMEPQQIQLVLNGERGDILQARIKQMMRSWKKAVSGDLQGASNAARANVLGLRYLLSTSNAPGGITQSSDNAYWQSKVDTGGGAFSLQPVNDDYDAIGVEGRSIPDILLLSHNSTVNMFGLMRDQVASLQRIVSAEKKVRFGFPSFIYLDMECFPEPDLGSALSTTGGYQMLSSDSFYWMSTSDNVERVGPPERLQGTGAFEYYYDMWCCLGCDDPAVNAYRTNFTG